MYPSHRECRTTLGVAPQAKQTQSRAFFRTLKAMLLVAATPVRTVAAAV